MANAVLWASGRRGKIIVAAKPFSIIDLATVYSDTRFLISLKTE
jgi:hypothetical protein